MLPTVQEPLFPGYDDPVPAKDQISVGRRRTLRQRWAIRLGKHPLTGGPLHPQADTEIKPGTGRNRPFRCGTCVHRFLASGGSRDYPKCDLGDGVYTTHSEATDVRGWWPACTAYEPLLTPDLPTRTERTPDD